jgi:pantetheine-phosphate adenylyltransferase
MLTGSFDPFTVGHLDLVKRVVGVFDKVYVAILVNPVKKYTFSVDQRLRIIHAALAGYDNVRVISYAGMTYDLAKQLQVDYLVRGIREESDFCYERDMAEYNLQEGGVDTICLMTNKLHDVSSGEVRRRLQAKESIVGYVPEQCIDLVERIYSAELDS